MLIHIKYCTKVLQTKHFKLNKCRDVLNMLIYDIEQNCHNPQSPLHEYTLETQWIGENSAKLHSIHFKKGIIKIQNNNIISMNNTEHVSCSFLLDEENDSTID